MANIRRTAIQNTLRHAGGASTDVRPELSGGDLVCSSFAMTGRAPDGTGLQGMADRLDAIGGTLEVESSLGSGTTVRGRIPIL